MTPPALDATRARRGLTVLDGLPREAAGEHLLACCGSHRWVDTMLAARPFDSPERLASVATERWQALADADVLEALAAHPEIGDRRVKPATGAAGWSAQEQSAAALAEASVQERLAVGNRAYAERFGFRFIICATGKGGEEILAHLERRLGNPPDAELRNAADEQLAILRLRLDKLLTALAETPA